jgi:hypothetical protein
MGKKKCRVCANERGGLCSIKKIGVAINKPRLCEAYIYDEGKLRTRHEIPTIRVGYKDHQESKRRLKEELKALKKSMEAGPSQGTAKDLGLIKPEESKIITAGDPEFYIPRTDTKHPLTGDLSRFLTTAKG